MASLESQSNPPSAEADDPTEISTETTQKATITDAWVNEVSQLKFEAQTPPPIEETIRDPYSPVFPPSGVRLQTPFIIPLESHDCSKDDKANVLCATMSALKAVDGPSPEDVFLSVFPPPAADHTTPTPAATPILFPPESGESSDGAAGSSQPRDGPPAVVQQHMYWSIAIGFLRMTDVTMQHLTDVGIESVREKYQRKRARLVDPAVMTFFKDWPARRGSDQDLVMWYLVELGFHFRAAFLPTLEKLWEPSTVADLETTVKLLYSVQSIYRIPFDMHILPMLEDYDAEIANRVARYFQYGLHDIFLSHIHNSNFQQRLGQIIYDVSISAFQIKAKLGEDLPQEYVILEEECHHLIRLMKKLHEVGVSGSATQSVFYTTICQVVQDFVDSHWMKVDWQERESVVPKLRRWIHRGLIPYALTVSRSLNGGVLPSAEYPLEKLTDIAIDRLGVNRVSILLELTKKWPESMGAIEDLKTFIISSDGRRHLASNFKDALRRRVLHAGATTTEILDMYIQIIRTFMALDGRGILLDMISPSIRKYLKQRPDTARIIVSSFLANTKDEGGAQINLGDDISIEIAKEMDRPVSNSLVAYDYDLDWDNMDWLPKPIDAGPDYKKNYADDATGHLLTLYERDEFVNALKNILGEHFINIGDESDLERETHLVELFKLRLGEDKLQACDVMLNDMKESARMNDVIEDRSDFQKAASAQAGGNISLRTMVLSSFFWPELRNDTFDVPAPIKALQDEYEKGFEAHKAMRKLTWLPGVGRVLVELQLEDRTIEEEVPTWAATVIYAFSSGQLQFSRTVDELVQLIHMPEPMVRSALQFWVDKRVLKEVDEDKYRVLEKLEDEPDQNGQAPATSASASTAANVEVVSAVKTTQDLMAEKADLYRQFVIGMLTNQGNLDLQRILMMLKMALPGGFPFSETELKEFLMEMVKEDQLAVEGSVFGVKPA